jgi:hypothetical protein
MHLYFCVITFSLTSIAENLKPQILEATKAWSTCSTM